MLIFDEHEAAEHGLNESIILNQMRYWLSKPHHDQDEREWIWNSYEQWQDQFPFWSPRTIQRAILSLERQGLVISTQKDIQKGRACKFYKLAQHATPVPICQGDGAKVALPSCQSGTMYTKEHKTTTEDNNISPHLTNARKINHFIQSKMREFRISQPVKFDDEETARILRLFDEDTIPVSANDIWKTLHWAWGHSFGDGTLYGAVLCSPKQWRKDAKMNKAVDKYHQHLRAVHDQRTREKSTAEYYGDLPPVPTEEEREADELAYQERERARLAGICIRAGVPFPHCPVEMETVYSVVFADGTEVNKVMEVEE